MSDILQRIAAYKADEVRARRASIPRQAIEARAKAQTAPRGFRAALARDHQPGRLALIAEIKKASPSKGLIRPDFDPPAHARAYQAGGASCLSVLTDGPSFQGGDADLTAARAASRLPVLRKEFLIDPWQVAESRAIGADAVLLILAIADDSLAAEILAEAAMWGMDVLAEAHDAGEIRRAARLSANLIGVNNRDLRTFITDLSTTETLAKEIPPTALLVTESGITTPVDARRLERAGAAAMLVGESLMRSGDIEAATRSLLKF
ncbi:MAG TPA: indole-3-glycerol phosphate synthase TrpC [Caulobacteraceae bacterium]|jgi:indole-3-glycerol phosphate synthase|nr:indole-3-glycerol phosphate synthase TrpC [Caulobacteraceae bacterium]